jgi:hypothetical protein
MTGSKSLKKETTKQKHTKATIISQSKKKAAIKTNVSSYASTVASSQAPTIASNRASTSSQQATVEDSNDNNEPANIGEILNAEGDALMEQVEESDDENVDSEGSDDKSELSKFGTLYIQQYQPSEADILEGKIVVQPPDCHHTYSLLHLHSKVIHILFLILPHSESQSPTIATPQVH